MIEQDACTRVLLRTLFNGHAKDILVTSDAVEHCGGPGWVAELCEFYGLKFGEFNPDLEAYRVWHVENS
jgi:hypothetical protein